MSAKINDGLNKYQRYARRHSERIRETKRRYREKHADKVKAGNRVRNRRYYRRHRDAIRRKAVTWWRQWYKKNRMHRRNYQRFYYYLRRDHLLEAKHRDYRKHHRKRLLAVRRRYQDGLKNLNDYYLKHVLRTNHEPITNENIDRCRTRIQFRRSKRFFRALAAAESIGNPD